jgi:predicted protein tyrosine phosphatase
MTVKNKHKVNQALWNKFKGDAAKKMFNDVMDQSLKNQAITTHPETPLMRDAQWRTICFNMACYAAWAVTNDALKKGAVVIDIDIKAGKETSRKIAR